MRKVGTALVGVGVFLIVVAFLLPFYAYPRLAVAPVDQNSITHLQAKGAVIFDSNPDVLANVTTDLSVTSRTVGDVKATKAAKDGVLVWVNTTSVRSSDGTIRSRSVERAAHDDHTGYAVDCCDSFVESEEGDRVPVTRTGLVFKFPFDTQKKDYPFWDGDLGKATTAKYEGVTRIKGMKVYKFVQEIPDTKVGTRDIPGSLVGVDKPGNVTADAMYANTRTMYVEPVTGAVINRIEDQDQRYVYNGSSLTTTKATLEFTDKQVQEMVDEIGTKARLLPMTQGLVPVLLGLVGLVMVGFGWVSSRRERPADDQDA